MGDADIEMPLAWKDRLRSNRSARAIRESREESAETGSETISDQYAVQDGVPSP
jgi:hypothetical protein